MNAAAAAFQSSARLCYSMLMTDHPKSDAAETPMERALRMKRAANQAKPKPPGAGKLQREQVAGVTAGASKPWMKK